MSNVTGSNYIPRKRAEPPIITVLTQQRRPVGEEKSCESFSSGSGERSEESRSERHRRPFGRRRIAHSADNRRYYLMSRGTRFTYANLRFRDSYVYVMNRATFLREFQLPG